MIQAYGLDIPGTLDDLCDPRRMALLVYDMQVGILEPDQEWGGDYHARSESHQSRARERHSCDLLSTHVFAEGAHGRVPNEDGP